jgi:hypothetical protein
LSKFLSKPMIPISLVNKKSRVSWKNTM